MNNFYLIILFIFSITIKAQENSLIEDAVNKINSELPITDDYTGVSFVKMQFLSNNIVCTYEVPENWFPEENLKSLMIDYFSESGMGKIASHYKLNYILRYFSENGIKKILTISHKDFKKIINKKYSLGNPISFKNHIKSKGLNFQIKKPTNFDLVEGNRPNIIFNFKEKDGISSYLASVKQSPFFFTKEASYELFEDDEFIESFIDGYSGAFNNVEIVNKDIGKVDRYPAIKVGLKFGIKFEDKYLDFKGMTWIVIYEDYLLTLNCIYRDHDLKNVFNRITNSIVFPDQYLETFESNSTDFIKYVDKFYENLSQFGIYPVRPKNIKIQLDDLDSNSFTTHIHGYSEGYGDENKIEIYISRNTWENSKKSVKYYLIYHELFHDVLDLNDLSSSPDNYGKIMSPEISRYTDLTMDDFILNLNNLLEEISSKTN